MITIIVRSSGRLERKKIIAYARLLIALIFRSYKAIICTLLSNKLIKNMMNF